MALFGLWGGAADRANKPAYSIDHLQNLYSRLQHIKDSDEQNRDATVEVIRQITEALIWGEQNGHDHNFFDFFCEKNILAHFVNVLGRPLVQKTVKVQLLQTLSMLVQNIRRDTSLYYLFSNNYVNQLISTQFDWGDEEVLSYYISFVKSLALRLNGETIKFFFNEHARQFNLYTEAIRFFGHHDQMVRTAVRTLTLQVYSIDDDAMREFVLERSSCTYFVHIACRLRELWRRLDAAARAAAGGGAEGVQGSLQELCEELQDFLMYISDVLELNCPHLAEILADRLLRYAFMPVLIGSILAQPLDAARTRDLAEGPAGLGGEPNEEPHLSLPCAFFILHQALDIFRSRAIVEPLVAALLRARLPTEVTACCLGPAPKAPPSYQANSPDVSGPSSSEATPEATAEAMAAIGPVNVGGGIAESACNGVDDLSPEAERSVRPRLLECLSGRHSDACSLLAAGVLWACLANRKVLPQSLLEGLLPSSPRRAKANQLLASLTVVPSCAATDKLSKMAACDGEENLAGHPMEVLVLAVQALEQQATLRVVVVQALASFALLLASDAFAHSQPKSRLTVLGAARRAEESAARQVRSFLHGALGDAFLDIFAEEWELRRTTASTPVSIREVCSNARCVLPPMPAGAAGVLPEWTLPAPLSERQQAAKAICCMLIIMQLRAGLAAAWAEDTVASEPGKPPEKQEVSSSPALAAGAPRAVPALSAPLPLAAAERSWEQRDSVAPKRELEASPLYVAEEDSNLCQEGRSLELGRQDRIVCGVVAPEGRHTRYLVLHQYLLLLVQPDLMHPGWAAVRTLAPVKQVEATIDRADPRTLRLVIRLAKGSPCPGEASPYNPSTAEPGLKQLAEEYRSSSFFLLTLSFEDVRRCQCADEHLRKRREEVRKKVRQNVEAFVAGLCG